MKSPNRISPSAWLRVAATAVGAAALAGLMAATAVIAERLPAPLPAFLRAAPMAALADGAAIGAEPADASTAEGGGGFGCGLVLQPACSPCGGLGQRACTVTERIPSCDSGLREQAGCSGNCTGPVFDSSGTCVGLSPCGGEGQRACTISGEGTPGCQSGLTEVPGCTGDCQGPVFTSSGTCIRLSACGGEGQRACTITEPSPGCQTGLTEVPTCVGDCRGPVFDSSGLCTRLSPCGGKGQRGCTIDERPENPGCDDGLTEVPGCSGDCLGKGLLGLKSLGMCGEAEHIAEPTTNAFPTVGECSMAGYADMHMHQFAHLAHGGGVLAGKPYDPAGVNTALGPDFTTALDLVNGDGSPLGRYEDASAAIAAAQTDDSDIANLLRDIQEFATNLLVNLLQCPSAFNCSQDYFHAFHDPLIGDSVGSFIGTKDGAGFSNFGAPLFNGWPRWTSTTHQQVYYKWLERAWQGGLRLMTELAVTNEALCRGSKHRAGIDCFDSMAAIDEQIDAAKAFQAFVDSKHGGTGKGWYRIVTTPLEARQVMASGKLAVVLGIETAELFNCYEDPDKQNVDSADGKCTPEYIDEQINKYYDKGVRHVFPIHNFDNAFGAAATWQDGIEVGQRVVEGRWWETYNCDALGYGFQLGDFTQTLITLLKFTAFIPTTESLPDRESQTATCNVRGMTSLGETLMNKLMAKGMIIDVDHMSASSFHRALLLAENYQGGQYPGIVASHVLSFDRHQQNTFKDGELKGSRHERLRTSQQLQRIKNVGGMVAAMLKDDGQDTDLKGIKYTIPYRQDVADDCRHSSKTFAHAYQYLVDQMDGPVALGSDFNGVAGHIGPRFGVEACGGDDGSANERAWQIRNNNRIGYPFTLPGFGTFNRQVTGQRTFDYNYDGMAHVGLLPDFVQDLKTVGMPQGYVDKMFGSAEAYVKMWESATAKTSDPSDDTPPEVIANPCLALGTIPPAVTISAPPTIEATSASGAPVVFTATATDPQQGTLPTTCNLASGLTRPLGPHEITCTATDADGNEGSSTVTVTVVDTTPPEMAINAPSPVEATSPAGAPVTFTTAAYDTVDGILPVTCSFLSGTVRPIGSTTIACSVADSHHNRREATAAVHVHDTTPPVLTTPTVPPREAIDASGAPVSFTVTAVDIVDTTPFFLCFPSSGAIFPVGPSTVWCFARDDYNNFATKTFEVQIAEPLPPVVTITPVPTLEATSSLGAVATFTASAVDNFDGPLPATCSPLSGATFPLGNTTVTCQATDAVGHVGTASIVVRVVDTTPPVVTCSADQIALSPPHHKMVPVRTTVTVTDGGSGPAGFVLLSATSNEPDNGLGDGDTANDIQGFVAGTPDVFGELRAERSGKGSGRVYTLAYQGRDIAGNVAQCTVRVTVPHNQSTSK